MQDYESYSDLPKPHIIPIDRMHDGPAYMVSSFHQLHCLVRQLPPLTNLPPTNQVSSPT